MAELTQRIWQYIKQPWRLAVPLKRIAIFLIVFSGACWIALWGFESLRSIRHAVFGLMALWLVLAYYFLPRIHRFLSNIYVPNYFIGRARTRDGLLADPVNLAVRGTKADLVRAMHTAGWHEADPITLKSSIGIVTSTLRKRSYPNAPVSDLYVFGFRQALAFQKEVDGNPSKRHHVRFWKLDKETYLPGGHDVDWVAAATYDDAVGFSLFTLQITHSIDGDVDAERDFVVTTLRNSRQLDKVQRITRFFPGYKDRNGGGDKFFTDGSMVIIDLKREKT